MENLLLKITEVMMKELQKNHALRTDEAELLNLLEEHESLEKRLEETNKKMYAQMEVVTNNNFEIRTTKKKSK